MPVTEQSHEGHVAVFAFPFGTHAAPLLTLVRRLAAAAPNVRFSFFNTAKSNSLIFSAPEADGLDNIKAYDVADGVPKGHVFSGHPQEGIGMFLKTTPENHKMGIEAAVAQTGRKISCLITDAFLWFAAEMAEELHVPWVPLWTAGPCSLATHVYTDLIRSTIGVNGIAGREDEALKFIAGMSAIRIGDLPEGILFGNLESPFSCMLHNMGLMLPRATAVAINSFEELDPTITNLLKSKFGKFLNVGPFTLTSPPPSNPDTNGCLSWLDKHEAISVAYISFGTVMTPPPNEIVALAEALEATGVPFLWSLKDHLKDHLPKGFLERTTIKGKVVAWTPQLQVLAHAAIGVFVTHCGWNSVSESILGGVPMICRPFFGDQRVNRRTVEDVWGIGVRVEGGVFTKTGTMSALELILCREEGKKMREKIRVFKELAIKAVGSKGSSIGNFNTLFEVVTTFKGT